MATELKHTVTPAGQGGDYNTLAAAIAHLVAVHADFVTADVYGLVEIDGDWSGGPDTAFVYVNGLTLDATRYLSIYTTAAARHDGKWNTGKYILSVSAGAVYSLRIADDYVRVDGLQVAYTTDVAASVVYVVGPTINACDTRLSNLIIKGTNSAANTQSAIRVDSDIGTGSLYVWNTIAYNFGVGGTTRVYYVGYAGNYYLYNCVSIGGDYGFVRLAGTVTAKNCYAGGSSTEDYAGTITKTTCASSDATGSAGLTGIAVSTQADATHAGFTNITAGTEDFHIVSGSPFIGAGTDTSGDAAPMNFTTDIDGETRS